MDGCVSTEALLAYVQGTASVAERGVVEGHASRCDECRRVLSSLARDPSNVVSGDAPTALTSVSASAAMTAADASGVLAPGAAVGRYVIDRRLGAGGMGVVYAAHDPELARAVAIKLLSAGAGSTAARAQFEERLRREARALAQLAHPNVVAIHDVGRVGDRLFIAMELLEGSTLSQWLAVPGRTPREIIDRFLEAGRGLAAAHAAGFVHRDVKPDNIMLGKDGRVRVVDFGLARSGPDAAESTRERGARSPTDVAGALTATGAMMGTPHYMAPEQHRGDDVDARTDQFAFCVSLYSALFRARPFAGDDLATIAAAVNAGAIREAPRPPGVSRRVERALRRGMATAPAARFATLDELLRELAPPRSRRWIPAVVAVPVLAAAVVVLATRHARSTYCEDMGVHLRGVWDAERSARVVTAVRATHAPGAETAARTIVKELDDYTTAWVAMRGDACRATRVRGDQSDEAMGLRLACLDDRLRDVDALAAQLEHADATAVAHAVTATHALGELAACSDLDALHKLGKPPRDPALVAELRGKLSEARALERAGHVREGLAATLAVAPRVQAVAYRPLEAEQALLEGTLRNDADASGEAIAALERAIFAAEASGYDRVAAEALIEVVHVDSAHGQFAAADSAVTRATAALERMGGDAALGADLDYAVGLGAIVRSDLDGATTHLQAALAAASGVVPPDDFRIAAVLLSLGQVELRRMSGHATPYLTRALAIDERIYGPDHPELAPVHVALGGDAYERSDYDGAAVEYEHAIDLLERAYGRQNLELANALANLALTRQWQGRAEDALAEIEETIAIDEALLPAGDPQTAAHLSTAADVLEQLDRHADALALLDRAIAMMRALYQGDHQDLADALHARALVELGLGDTDTALTDGREALAMFHRVDPAYPTLELERTLGKIELARHDPTAALAYFDAAKQHLPAGVDPTTLPVLDGLRGRALVEAGQDRATGVALVRAAYTTLHADPRAEDDAAELAAWMTAHRISAP